MTKILKDGVLLMTALPPTLGHEYAIWFAATFLEGMQNQDGYKRQLFVIVPTRSKEPMRARHNIVRDICYRLSSSLLINIVVKTFEWDDAPQNPPDEGQEIFWNTWVDKVKSIVEPTGEIGYYFSSEEYGNSMAEFGEWRHISIDSSREMIDVKATFVRQALTSPQWKPSAGADASYLPQETIRALGVNIVLFGAESVGKTSTAKLIAKIFNGRFVPEWARQYLVTTKHPCDAEAMLDITLGQNAQEEWIHQRPELINVMDTNLLSTLGYYRLSGIEMLHHVRQMMKNQSSRTGWRTLYIVMNNDAPFVADEIRFGGDKRESDTKLWVDILNEHQCNYVVIEGSDYDERNLHALAACRSFLESRLGSVANFQRD